MAQDSGGVLSHSADCHWNFCLQDYGTGKRWPAAVPTLWKSQLCLIPLVPKARCFLCFGETSTLLFQVPPFPVFPIR